MTTDPDVSNSNSKTNETGFSKSPLIVDREKTCPLLLRCFWRLNRPTVSTEYNYLFSAADASATSPSFLLNEVQIYTWKDATLGELIDLIKHAVPETAERPATYILSFAFPDKNSNCILRKVLICIQFIFLK